MNRTTKIVLAGLALTIAWTIYWYLAIDPLSSSVSRLVDVLSSVKP